MAVYCLRYSDDFGLEWVLRAEVFLVVGGSKVATEEEWDKILLPGEWWSRVEPTQVTCAPPVRPRAAKIFLDEDEYLFAPFPLAPATPQYRDCYQKLLFHPKVLYIATQPEYRNAFYTALVTDLWPPNALRT